MAEFAIQIVKETSFQGAAEEFSNVYTLSTEFAEGFNDIAAIDAIVAIERAVFGTSVNFRQANSYDLGPINAANVMREVKDLSGTGAVSGNACYKECAVLFTWELPRSLILRRRRIGRKWLHVCMVPSGIASPGAFLDGSAIIPAAMRTFYLDNYAIPLTTGTFGGADFASAGDPFTSPAVNDYLEHRQFHR
jgi:hypothetical protein